MKKIKNMDVEWSYTGNDGPEHWHTLCDWFAEGAKFAYQSPIALEKESSPYANIIAVRKEDENNENVKKLVKVLRSKEVQDWITKKWNGAIVPVNE